MIKVFKGKKLPVIIGIATFLIFSGCTNRTDTAQNSEPAPTEATIETTIETADVNWDFYNELALEFVTASSKANFDKAAEMFDEEMTKTVGESGLQRVWESNIPRAGQFISIHDEIENMTVQGYYICLVTSWHEKSGVTLRIVFSEDGLIAGLFTHDFTALPDDSRGSLAGNTSDSVQRNGFIDYNVIIGEGTDFPLNGILSIPNNAYKVPAAVIVHGSGPLNMDGAVFENKPYRDIADHLAENGIAVIRYDKRVLTHVNKLPQGFTVWEETIEDAILAAELLKSDPRIDENKVFIIGHSLGGLLAPRIHAEGGDFAGLILLAGSPRYLLDISKDQNIVLIKEITEEEELEAAIAAFEEQWHSHMNALINMPEDIAKTTHIEGGTTVYYFQDLYNNPVAEHIQKITQPFLIMQGSADFQITAENDFSLYQELFAGRSNAAFKLYEGLNHLFMASATGTIEEYEIESRVDERVLTDIVQWIMGQ